MSGTRSSATAAEGTPVLSRRHAAGAPSARGLLFTLLGEFALPGDGTAWTSAALAVLARLGIEEKATRQALMRTAAAGWLEAEKHGRRTRWRLTASARRMLTEGAERIYSFTGPSPSWDGRWVLVFVRVPESDRRARHVVLSRLSWAGFGSLGAGMWVSPHPEREAEAIRALRDAGVAGDAHIFVATRVGLGDARGMAADGPHLPAAAVQYERSNDASGARSPADSPASQIELVQAWPSFPAVDPALPRELRPAPWSG